MAEDQPNPNRSPDDETPAADDGVRVPNAADPDATRPVDPDAARAVDPDATRAVDPDATRPVDPDATQVTPAFDADATRVVPPADPDATRAIPPGDAAATPAIRPQTPDPTAVFPAVPETWRGTAAPRVARPDADETSTWDPAQPAPGRGWWLPILLSIIGVLILVGIAFALVVAMRGNSSPTPTTPPIPLPTTQPASIVPVTPSAVPSTPPTPSISPTPTPVSSFVTVPANLVGLLTPDVESELDSVGLKYQLVPQVDANDIENTVLSVTPISGSAVPPGSTVQIVFAVPPPPPSPSDSASPATQ